MNRKQNNGRAGLSRHSQAQPNRVLQKAMSAFEEGALDDAEKSVRAVLDLAPEQSEAWDLLASIYERRGSTADAVAILKHALGILPQAADLHSSLGRLYSHAGNGADAETHLRYALTLDPSCDEAAAALGNLLARHGRYEEAGTMFQSAMSSAPDEPVHPLQLGRILLTLGRPQDARPLFQQAANLAHAGATSQDGDGSAAKIFSQTYYDALVHLAALAFNEGRPEEALSYLKKAVTGGDKTIEVQFANCVCSVEFTAPRPDLKPLLARAIEEAWIMPADLVRASSRLLLLEPAFKAAQRWSDAPDGGPADILSDPHARNIASDPLLRAALNFGVVTDPALERMLTVMRSALLRACVAGDDALGDDGPYCAFSVALANQCFTNEYAFAESQSDSDAVTLLEARIGKALQENAAVLPADLALLGAYRPLGKIACADAIAARSWPPVLESLITRQLREPLKEEELKASIARITAIADATSKLVQDQYEENPFPRWIKSPVVLRSHTLDDWLAMHFPNVPPSGRQPTDRLEVLVAGCGTGQETIGTAQRFHNANVLAIDLSLSSLAYAARKSAEIGLTNVAYGQADILELGGLERRFDIVECAGVLHHLAEPIKGWRILSDLTAPGGYMIVALYSTKGREDLRPVSEFIAKGGYGTSAGELRRFRSDLLALAAQHPARAIVSSRDDFYNLSMLRDMAFHVQEHSYTIRKIAEALKTLNLQFCGFGTNPEARRQFQKRFGERADLSSLELWDRFEAENPDTFSGMYHFVVRKA